MHLYCFLISSSIYLKKINLTPKEDHLNSSKEQTFLIDYVNDKNDLSMLFQISSDTTTIF